MGHVLGRLTKFESRQTLDALGTVLGPEDAHTMQALSALAKLLLRMGKLNLLKPQSPKLNSQRVNVLK